MPLPAALRAKLQQRGILDENGMPVTSANHGAAKFAVVPKVPSSGVMLPPARPMLAVPEFETVTSFIGCPNKCNPYHVCIEYCRQRWGAGFVEPDKYIQKKRQLMLLKYPKPAGWKEIFDPGTGRHYYWNTTTDEVSWLPPEHPKAYVTVSANRLRGILSKTDFKTVPEVTKYMFHNKPTAAGETMEASSLNADEHGLDPISLRFEQQYGSVQTMKAPGGGKAARYKPDREKDTLDLDPMDPAAYSDVPRGGWGVGLETGVEAKTGVDATASGPLFQSRPYPSPGSILRRNAGIPEKKK